MNCGCALLVGKRIDGNLVGNHECGVESESEMTDNLVIVCLVFVFLDEIRRSGERDLVDILLYFVSRHSETVIGKGHRFLLGAYNHIDARLIIKRSFILAHHFKFLELSDRITSVGDQFSDENVVIRIQPFLDNRENILAVNGK